MNKCIQCLNEFESKRVDAKYCSSTCRSKSSRATDNATDKSDNIFEKLERIRVQYGYKNITPELLTRETGIRYSFVPSWLQNNLSLQDLSQFN